MITSSSFHLSWIEPLPADQNGLIRQYLVNITELNTGNVFPYTTTETEFTVESLHPYCNYSCSVSAVTVSAGPYSSLQTVQTDIDGKYVFSDHKVYICDETIYSLLWGAICLKSLRGLTFINVTSHL